MSCLILEVVPVLGFFEREAVSLFSNGARHRWSDGRISRLDVIQVGDISIPTGWVVVRDPAAWVTDDAEEVEPFTLIVPVGRWRVSVSVVHWDVSPDPLVPPPLRAPAAIKVELGDADIRSWELGLRPGDKAPVDDGDDLAGFGADGGMGCLLDVSDLGFLREMQRNDLPKLLTILDEVDEAAVVRDAEAVGDILVFACGMGDGVYPTWIGRDSEGVPVSLLVDLEMLSHSLGLVTLD
ncbi:DUF4241 domain-containing protein [Kribbella soli]|uniref:DUF4241 domain-containing protein n=1 Tax=Kribbella soli TaxID=1124743 RepID=A0A4R0H0C2_9ACTN|nr:DUF4241 domain-containing protein [Kribbella soli]TCC03975.1 DUF4241 domain-containing protein [Kribbella soli]